MLETSPDYPRVLVVGPEPFSYVGAVGITISNLFSGWPKDRLACLHFTGIPPDKTICEHHYGLDSRNLKWPLVPQCLARIFRKKRTGNTINDASLTSPANSSPSLKWSTRMVASIKQAISVLGVGCLARIRISEDLKAWVKSYRPDVIYCAVTDLTQIEFVLSVAKLTQAAIVTHALDDWIVMPFQNENIFQHTIRRYSHQRLKHLYRRSSVCLAIGEEMSRVYLKRYGIEFLPFFNCPDADYWISRGKTDWKAQKPFRFVFAGGVYLHGNQASLIRFAEAVELVHGDEACTLEVYSGKAGLDRLRPILQRLVNTTVHLPCKDTETVAKLFRDAGALVLPLDFREGMPSSLHLSMGTRLPPFLLSGTPIFAFAPSDTAMGRFFLERHNAYRIVEWMEAKELAQHITEFVKNEDRRRKIGLTARRMAAEELAGEVVRPRFREAIRSAVRRHMQSEWVQSHFAVAEASCQ